MVGRKQTAMDVPLLLNNVPDRNLHGLKLIDFGTFRGSDRENLFRAVFILINILS